MHLIALATDDPVASKVPHPIYRMIMLDDYVVGELEKIARE